MSSQDAGFLYFERPETPLHIGSIATFEGDVSYEAFTQSLASRLHQIPRYLQRAVFPPLNVGHPTWEFDPEFDIRKHVHSVRIDAPGSDAQLMELAPQLFSGMLDRNRPLWEMYLVEGLEGPRTALVSKVHHCLVDGVSGIGLLMMTLDVSPNPPPPPPPAQSEPPVIPDPATLLSNAVWDRLAEGLDRWAAAQKDLLRLTLRGDDGRAKSIANAAGVALPHMAKPMHRASFNRAISGDRKLACSEFPFAEVRAMRHAAEVTVNDVVLAVLGGAMARYLRLHGEQAQVEPLRVLVPVNVRREDEEGAMGNRVSMLPIEIPVDVCEPLDRLRAVSNTMRTMKEDHVADGLGLMADFLGTVPPSVQAAAGSAPLPKNTLAHMVCTNVPGPMIQLYTVGHRMLAHYPLVPIAWDMGLACGVTSYNQMLYFGLIADARAPIAQLEERLGESLLSGERDEDVDTLGGLVFTLLGRVPVRGEIVPHSKLIEFEILDADPRRIKKLRVHLHRQPTDDSDGPGEAEGGKAGGQD